MQRSIPFFARIIPVMEKQIPDSNPKGREGSYDKLDEDTELDYEKSKSECKTELDEFFESMQENCAEYEEAAKMAAYVVWSYPYL